MQCQRGQASLPGLYGRITDSFSRAITSMAPAARRIDRASSDAINRAPKSLPRWGAWLQVRADAATIARIDTALRAMHDLNEPAACLNLPRVSPGGGYPRCPRTGGRPVSDAAPVQFLLLHKYPIKEHEAFFTRTWLCRTAGNYYLVGPPVPVDVITAAMPNLNTQHGGPAAKLKARGSKWTSTVRLRIRAVLHAARDEGCDAIILGAFGCGAFANLMRSQALC